MQSATSVICLMFLVLVTRDSFANTHHGLEKMAVQAGNELAAREVSRLTTTDNKDIYNVVPTGANVGDRDGKLRGRKMMKKIMFLNKGVVKEEVMTSGEAPKGKGTINTNCKLSDSSLNSNPMKVKVGGFMTFNADYHVPKLHPPKNN